MRIVGVRMRFGWLWILLLSSALVVATADVAWAHVVVSPKEASTDSYQKFTVSVPTEKDVPTTEVRIEVPEGFIVTGVQPVPDWRYEFEKDSDDIKAITWSGGKIDLEEFQEFAFQARTPKDSGEFPWKVYQTYEDGSVVEWTGPPDAEEPASVVKVVSGGPALQAIAAYAGLGLGAVALVVVALLALRQLRSP